ncbi:MAG: L-serine ammonia-lyase, iron-sulfur-dependent, subunit alpha [Thermovirgaceae bacterium]|nr:L-serine ammonia-lyase, iron-sulfur-dependent, subunit alpha [Thermovirgaceae bacterium]
MDLAKFLSNEVKPALGCTEPGAVALAASWAARHGEGDTKVLRLHLSPNIYKNGLHAGIPGTDGQTGNLLAAALGALKGDPEKGLMALENVNSGDVDRALALVRSGVVTQKVLQDVPPVYVEVELVDDSGSISVVISGRHDRVVEIRKNGRIVKRLLEADNQGNGRPSYLDDLLGKDMEGLWETSALIDEDMEGFLLEGSKVNLDVARKGLERPWGMGTGFRLAKLRGMEDLLRLVKAWSAAAADVRMAGGSWPVMSSAGSGNHGITAIIPPSLAAEKWKKSGRELAEALALSHLVTGFIKAHTGRLTPVCGCAVAAGAGAAAAIVRLGGGTPKQGEIAVALLLSSLQGMICDGAKGSCALKVSTAAGEAFISAELALGGMEDPGEQGVISSDFVDSARNIGLFSRNGLSAADSAIIRILQEMESAKPGPV